MQADGHRVVGGGEGLVVDADHLERLAPQLDGPAHLGAQSLGHVAAHDGFALVVGGQVAALRHPQLERLVAELRKSLPTIPWGTPIVMPPFRVEQHVDAGRGASHAGNGLDLGDAAHGDGRRAEAAGGGGARRR